MLAIFALALLVRLVTALVISAVSGGSLFLDDRTYWGFALSKTGTGDPIDALLFDRSASLLTPVSTLIEVFGPHRLLGQLYAAVVGAVAAALTTRLALELVSARAALVTGLFVAVLPSQVLFSSVMLKDPVIWAALAGLAVIAAVANRSQGVRLAFLGASAVGVLFVLGHLRLQTLVIAAWALLGATLVGQRAQRIPRVAAACAIACFFPWLAFGIGPGGVDLVPRSDILERERIRTANPELTEVENSGVGSDLAHLPAGISAILVEPTPFHRGGTSSLDLARAEAVLWYGVLALALLGLMTLKRRQLRTLAFPLLASGAIVVTWALVHGNLGTTYRHRGEIQWTIALLAGLGVVWLGQRRQAGTVDRTSSSPSNRSGGTRLRLGR